MELNTLFDGKYRIIRLLGAGGCGHVYLAENVRFKSLWAIKEITYDDAKVAQVDREIETLKRIRHPALPRIVDVLREDGKIYLVEDYLEGRNVEEILKEYHKIDVAIAIAWAHDICDIMIYLHGQKPEPIIYRDLKPSNIILSPEGSIRLIDFGSVRHYKANSPSDTIYIGTRGYAAPEQYGFGQTTKQTDVYSFGVTMLQVITGMNLSQIAASAGGSYGEDMSRLADACQNNPIERAFIMLLSKCIELAPMNRYQDFEAVKAELDICRKMLESTGANKTASLGLKLPDGGQACAEQPRAEQPRAGQAHAGQSLSGQAHAGQSLSEQALTGQARVGQSRAGQARTGQTTYSSDMNRPRGSRPAQLGSGQINIMQAAQPIPGGSGSFANPSAILPQNKKSTSSINSYVNNKRTQDGASPSMHHTAAGGASQAMRNGVPGSASPVKHYATPNGASPSMHHTAAGGASQAMRNGVPGSASPVKHYAAPPAPLPHPMGIYRCATISVTGNHEFAFELAYRATERYGLRVLILDLDFETSLSDSYLHKKAAERYGVDNNSLFRAVGLVEQANYDDAIAGIDELTSVSRTQNTCPEFIWFNEPNPEYSGITAEKLIQGDGRILRRLLAEITVHADVCLLLTGYSVFSELNLRCFQNSHYVICPGHAGLAHIKTFKNTASLAEQYKGISSDRFKYVIWEYHTKDGEASDIMWEFEEGSLAGAVRESRRRVSARNNGQYDKCYARSMERGVKKDYDDIINMLGISRK